MKRTQWWIAILLLVTVAAVAQTPTPAPAQGNTQTQPQAQQGAAQGQTGAQAQPTPPQRGKKQREAKTQEEYDAYVAVARTPGGDLAALENAAAEYEKKHPNSELTILLYLQLMGAYQSANNPDKATEMARKANALDPTDPVSAMVVAMNLGDRVRETDLDRDERVAEIQKFANSALQNVENRLIDPNLTPEQVEAGSNDIRKNAHIALGQAAAAKTDHATAEKHFQAAIGLMPAGQSDPFVYLLLALSQDKQKKYPEALASAQQAQKVAPPNSPFAQAATQQINRLKMLMGQPTGQPAAKPAAPAAQPGTAKPAPPATGNPK